VWLHGTAAAAAAAAENARVKNAGEY